MFHGIAPAGFRNEPYITLSRVPLQLCPPNFNRVSDNTRGRRVRKYYHWNRRQVTIATRFVNCISSGQWQSISKSICNGERTRAYSADLLTWHRGRLQPSEPGSELADLTMWFHRQEEQLVIHISGMVKVAERRIRARLQVKLRISQPSTGNPSSAARRGLFRFRPRGLVSMGVRRPGLITQVTADGDNSFTTANTMTRRRRGAVSSK